MRPLGSLVTSVLRLICTSNSLVISVLGDFRLTWQWHPHRCHPSSSCAVKLMSIALLCRHQSNPALLTRCRPSYYVSMLTCLRHTWRQSSMHHWVKVVYRTVKNMPGQDSADMASFRPVSNLSLLSKVIESSKLTRQLNAYLMEHGLLPHWNFDIFRHCMIGITIYRQKCCAIVPKLVKHGSSGTMAPVPLQWSYWESCTRITFDGQIGSDSRMPKWLRHFGPWSLRSLVTSVFFKGPKWPGTEVTKDRSGCNSCKWRRQ